MLQLSTSRALAVTSLVASSPKRRARRSDVGDNRLSPILPVFGIAAACCGVIGLAARLSKGFATGLAAYIAAELGFLAYQRWRYRVCNAVPHEAPDITRIPAIKEQFLELAGVMDLKLFVSGWFHDAPFESVGRENLEEFIAYGFYNAPWEALSSETQRQIQQFLTRVEAAWSVRLPEGRNSHVAFMRHLWEPLRVSPRPLVVALIMELAPVVCRAAMWRQGYRRCTTGDVEFFVKPPSDVAARRRYTDGWSWRHHRSNRRNRSVQAGRQLFQTATGFSPLLWGRKQRVRHSEEQQTECGAGGQRSAGSGGHRGFANDAQNQRRAAAEAASDLVQAGGLLASDAEAIPIVFLHGVGLGMLPYLHFTALLAEECPRHPIIMLESRHVSMRLHARAATVDEVAHAAAGVLSSLGHRRAHFVGHSYGTFVISRVCQLYPDLVASTLIADPVCMMTCYPQLLANFVYKPPRLAGRPLLEKITFGARYIAARDLVIAQVFCRRFYWHELMLWPKDIPEHAIVALSANDDLVPAELVQGQLKAAGSSAKVVVHPTAGHGGFIADPAYQRRIVADFAALLLEAEGRL